MLQRILELLTSNEAVPATGAAEDLRDAVAALLVEAARMDDEFDTAERASIVRLLTERFGLTPWEVQQLVTAAESAVANSAQLFPFTQAILKNLSVEERGEILELMWRVAYADGVLDPHEDMLIRRVAGLVAVPDRERGEARRRALRKIGVAK